MTLKKRTIRVTLDNRATFKFYTSVCEADTLEEAKDKAYQLDGDYFVNKSEVLDMQEDWEYNKQNY
jgi:hypothetical protein